MKLSVNQVYTSIACNRTPEIIDWNSDGLICYGGSNAVVIYDTVRDLLAFNKLDKSLNSQSNL